MSVCVFGADGVEQQGRFSRRDGIGAGFGQSQRCRECEGGLRIVCIRGGAAQTYTASFLEKRTVEGDLRSVRRVIDRSDVDAQL